MNMPFAFSIKAFSLVAVLFASWVGSRAQSADDLIEKGDVFDSKFQAGEALKYYLPAEKLEPKNVHLLCRIARQSRNLMSDAPARE